MYYGTITCFYQAIFISLFLWFGCFWYGDAVDPGATKVQIGIIVPVSSSTCTHGLQYWVTSKIARDYIHSQNWWLPDWQIELVPVRGDSSYQAWHSTRNYLLDGPCGNGSEPTVCNSVIAGFVGPTTTDETEYVQFATMPYGMPLLSYSATGATLTRGAGGLTGEQRDESFFRVVYTDALAAVALWRAVENFGWLQASVIYEATAYGRQFEEVLQRLESDSKIGIRITNSFLSESVSSIDSALKEIDDSGVRIILLIAGRENAALVLQRAHILGMYGKGWTWLGDEWVSPDIIDIPYSSKRDDFPTSESRAIASNRIRDVLDGAVGVVADNSAAKQFKNGRLTYFPPSDYIQSSNPGFADESYLGIPPSAATCSSLQAKPFADGINRPDSFVPFVFDAVWVLAQAMTEYRVCNLSYFVQHGSPLPQCNFVPIDDILDDPLSFSSQIVASLRGKLPIKSPVTQLHVDFDAYHDRRVVGLQLVNIRDNKPHKVAHWKYSDAVYRANIVDWGAAGDWSEWKTVVWPGGSTEVPPDRTETSSTGKAWVFAALLIGVTASLMLGVVLHKYHIHVIPESGITILVGVVFGLVIKNTATEEMISAAEFDESIFMLVMLPIIIFESGYALDIYPFFSQFFSILTFAVFGTLVATFAIGLILYQLGTVGLSLSLSIEEALSFASLISAVDPVAVLATFSVLQVDPTLNALVYGEAVINDAVAIVLFRTFTGFLVKETTGAAIGQAIGTFIGVLIGSVAIGGAVGMLCTLFFRFESMLWPGAHPPGLLQTAIPLLLAYGAFGIAEGSHLSGIVASLFCGVFMNHYLQRAMTPEGRALTSRVFRLLAVVAETAVFLQVGVNVVIYSGVFDVRLVLWTIVLCLITRAFNVFPLSALLNIGRRHKISYRYQAVMWHAGLRGAVAYATSIIFPTQHRDQIVNATAWVVMFTIFIQGGSTTSVLKWLGVPMGREAKQSLIEAREERIRLNKETQRESPCKACLARFDRRIIRPFLYRKAVLHHHRRNAEAELQRQMSPTDAQDDREEMILHHSSVSDSTTANAVYSSNELLLQQSPGSCNAKSSTGTGEIELAPLHNGTTAPDDDHNVEIWLPNPAESSNEASVDTSSPFIDTAPDEENDQSSDNKRSISE